MYFGTKNYLKNNRNHTAKHTFKIIVHMILKKHIKILKKTH
jgi:hypothetical protein